MGTVETNISQPKRITLLKMQSLIFTLFLVIGYTHANSEPACVTVRGDYCIFPFTYEGKEYNYCTFANSEDGEPWCATQVNGLGRFSGYQNCDRSLCNILPEPPIVGGGCRTIDGPDAGNACVFPFTHNGVTYDDCASYEWRGPYYGQNWCSTETDVYGNHVRGKFGICDLASTSCSVGPGYNGNP